MSYDHWKATEGNPYENTEDEPEDDGPPEFYEGRTGKWIIHYDPPPIPLRTMDWHFRHDDYDPTPWDSGGPPLDHRQGHAASWGDCVDQIRDLEAEELKKEAK